MESVNALVLFEFTVIAQPRKDVEKLSVDGILLVCPNRSPAEGFTKSSYTCEVVIPAKLTLVATDEHNEITRAEGRSNVSTANAPGGSTRIVE
jgi:hypothetical protein